MSSRQDADADPLVGQSIGSYIVQRKLGEGGMGAVYELLHPGIGKRLALKLLHAEYASKPQIVQRFFDEARAVNVIQHPNIVDIIDFAQLDDGSSYITMEFLEGDSLGEHIRDRGAMTPAEVAAIVVPICSALGAAHERGIVHRDLKPENIHLVPRPDNPHYVKVLDFGIAKLSSDLQVGPGGATKSGVVMGTPTYMSPEQAMGRTKEIDHRTDIYALGVITYQMLSGTVPFEAESFGDLMLMHLQAPVTPLHERRPDLPPAWDAVVQRALAKRREQRFQSMSELAEAVKAASAGAGTGAGAIPAAVNQPTLAMQSGPVPAPPAAYAYGTAPGPAATPSGTGPGTGPGTGVGTAGGGKGLLVAALGVAAVAAAVILFVVLGGGSREGDGAAAQEAFAADAGAAAAATTAAPDAAVAAEAPAIDAAVVAAAPAIDAAVAANPRVEPRDPPREREPVRREKVTVRFTARPWATIYVNGRKQGATPVTVQLDKGRRYRIKAVNPDLGVEKTATLKATAGAKRHFELQ